MGCIFTSKCLTREEKKTGHKKSEHSYLTYMLSMHAHLPRAPKTMIRTACKLIESGTRLAYKMATTYCVLSKGVMLCRS